VEAFGGENDVELTVVPLDDVPLADRTGNDLHVIFSLGLLDAACGSMNRRMRGDKRAARFCQQ
jgi:hypothetical protein